MLAAVIPENSHDQEYEHDTGENKENKVLEEIEPDGLGQGAAALFTNAPLIPTIKFTYRTGAHDRL